MKKRLLQISAVCAVAIIAVLSTQVAAATKEWTNGGGDDLWRKTGNWNPSGAPTTSDAAVVNLAPGPYLENPYEKYVQELFISRDIADPNGTARTGVVSIFGGYLHINTNAWIGWGPGQGTLNVIGAGTKVDIQGGSTNFVYVGYEGKGSLIIEKGDVVSTNVIGPTWVVGSGVRADANGLIHMKGGHLIITNNLFIGSQSRGELRLDYGLVQTRPNYIWVGYGPNIGNGKVTISDGMLDCGNFLMATQGSNAQLIMNGGTLDSSGWLVIDNDSNPNNTAHVQLNAGLINLEGNFAIGAHGTMDIREGTLRINADQTASINSYIAANKITAYGGHGTVNVSFVWCHDPYLPNCGTTYVTATPCGAGIYPAGDLNVDCHVNFADLAILASNWLH